MTRRRTRRLVPLLVVLGLGAAACGNGDGEATEIDRATPTTAPADTTTTTEDGGDEAVAPEEEGSVHPTEAPERPGSAADAARRIEEAERIVRDPGTAELPLARAAQALQVAYRAVADNPDWDVEVRAALPGDLHRSLERNVHASRELHQLVRPREELPAWRIVEPDPADELLDHYRAAEAEFGVGWEFLAAIHLVETRMGRIRGTSIAGAQGPMQFLPSTWEAYGEGDINDTGDAIRAAARYLRANGAPADMDNALYRYNPTERYVNAVHAYAAEMRDEPRTFRGYYHWQVYYTTVHGTTLLPVGYAADQTRPVTPDDVPVARA